MTEIFGTLGPACAQADLLEQMFLEGMTGMRLNTSHSGLKESEPLLEVFWQAAQRAGVRPELLIDMQGPEIRTGVLDVPLHLEELSQAVFVSHTQEKGPAGVSAIPVDDQILSEMKTGDHILLDDGRMELVITATEPQITARVLQGGVLLNKKSLKIVNKAVSGPVMTSLDRENIRLAKEYGVTALMQPFVSDGEQLSQVRAELGAHQMDHVRVFAKIENRAGLEQIRDIMPGADMIVIARGDLGNDMPLWELPAAQKTLAEICRKEGKPFLVVTQMLASMVHHPYPTRAEVSDIFHAVADGASAVMVTNETAVGDYPVEVIRYLKKTALEAEVWVQTGRHS